MLVVGAGADVGEGEEGVEVEGVEVGVGSEGVDSSSSSSRPYPGRKIPGFLFLTTLDPPRVSNEWSYTLFSFTRSSSTYLERETGLNFLQFALGNMKVLG